jgi:hypothetical protein
MNDQIDATWVKVGTYSNAYSAKSASTLLTSLKIPNTMQCYGTIVLVECYIWVPRECEANAKEALEASIPEEELTADALKEPPPDDA